MWGLMAMGGQPGGVYCGLTLVVVATTRWLLSTRPNLFEPPLPQFHATNPHPMAHAMPCLPLI